MKVAIVRHNAGNVRSLANALARLQVSAVISDDWDTIRQADRIIFPGVGAAAAAMQALQERGLARLLPTLLQPFLGICLGMQLLANASSEGMCRCLGVFDQPVIRFPNIGRVPHTGWNQLVELSGPLFKNVAPGSYAYFVHSYYLTPSPITCARTDYLATFSAAIRHNNFYGVQFHPEKSGATGEQILRNFLELT